MRTGGQWLMCAAAAGQVLVLTGCGGGSGSPSAAEYRKSLNALCASAAAFDRSLPHLQQSQHLSVEELTVRANQESASFRSGVTHLTPPAGLSGAHQALLADLDHPSASTSGPVSAPVLAVLAKYAHALLSDYTALGASGCEAFERQAIAAVEAAGHRRPAE